MPYDPIPQPAAPTDYDLIQNRRMAELEAKVLDLQHVVGEHEALLEPLLELKEKVQHLENLLGVIKP
jgi:hypothetical protein